MCFVTEDRIADVVEVGHLALVEEHAVLQLHGIAHHTTITHDDVFADIGPVPAPAPSADDGRADDHRPRLHDRTGTDEHLRSHMSRRVNLGPGGPGLEVLGQVAGEPFEGVPWVLDPIEQSTVRGLA